MVADLLLDELALRGETLATAESLTGGMLAQQLTAVAGASRVFVGGAVTYATRAKTEVLGVPAQMVAEHGVISSECAAAMATGARQLLGATWAVATTGVAGPSSQEGQPVGTVWIAAAGPRGVQTEQLLLDGDRDAIRQATCAAALSLLHGILREEETGLR